MKTLMYFTFLLCESTNDKISLIDLIGTYSKKNDVKILVNADVNGEVYIFGEDPDKLSYDNLLAILDANKYTITQRGDYLIVIPNTLARLFAPLSSGQQVPDNQYITDIIYFEKACSYKMIPVLRPLVQRTGYLVSLLDTNSIVVTDVASNVARIKTIANNLDKSLEKKLKCKMNT